MSATMAKKKGKPAGRPGRKPLGDRPKDRAGNRHVSPRESFHLPPDLHGTFLDFVRQTDPPSDKSAILRSALEEYLRSRGLWPLPSRKP